MSQYSFVGPGRDSRFHGWVRDKGQLAHRSVNQRTLIFSWGSRCSQSSVTRVRWHVHMQWFAYSRELWAWEGKVTQSCLTLCNPIDYTVRGILQTRILEWVAFPFSRGSSWPRNPTGVSCIAGRFFTHWATWFYRAQQTFAVNGALFSETVLFLLTHGFTCIAQNSPGSFSESPSTPAVLGISHDPDQSSWLPLCVIWLTLAVWQGTRGGDIHCGCWACTFNNASTLPLNPIMEVLPILPRKTNPWDAEIAQHLSPSLLNPGHNAERGSFSVLGNIFNFVDLKLCLGLCI